MVRGWEPIVEIRIYLFQSSQANIICAQIGLLVSCPAAAWSR